MLPALFCSTLLSLQFRKKKIWQKYLQWEREKKRKLWRNIFFLFVCISFLFLRFFFLVLSYVLFFFSLEKCPQWWPTNKHTQKKIINPIISASIAQSQRGFGDGMESYCPYSWMNTEGGRRRRRRRRKKVNKVHGGESSNSSRRQKMAAQLTVRKHSPHCHAGGVSACVVWMLNKQIKKKTKELNHH